MSLRVRPTRFSQLKKLVADWHRHHKPPVGHRFSLLCQDKAGVVHGSCSVGRPTSRELDPDRVAEVTRLVTDGTKNACSILYAAAARACAAMGYDYIQTYILEHEPGTSLKAAGWYFDGMTKGGDWNCPSRGGRRIDQPQGPKQRWRKDF